MSTRSCNWIVKCRRAVSAVVGVSFLALLAPLVQAAELARELYVVDAKRPAVAVVDPVAWTVLASIPIDAEPTAALLGRRGRFLYVLHRGLFRPDGGLSTGQSSLSIVDLQSRAQVASIPLGWNTTDIAFSRDRRYLLCVSEGKAGKKDTPDTHGSVVVVDAETNAVTATLPAGRFGLRVAATEDGSRLFVLSIGDLQKKKNGATSVLAIFAPDNAKPLAEIPLGRAARLMLAQDDRWLYVLDAGLPSKKPAEHRNGTVHVVDVAAATLARTVDVGTAPRGLIWDAPTESAMVLAQTSFKDQSGRLVRLHGTESPEVTVVGTSPRYVRRLDDSMGSLVVSHEDMRLLRDGGSAYGPPLVLNPLKGAARGSAASLRLDGTPGELLPLADQNRVAVSVLNPQGAGSKVAILNLKENRVEHVLTTGRGSVKFGKFLGSVALSAAMSSLSYYAGAMAAQSSGSPFFFYNVYNFTPAPPNVELAASPDGRFVYALNTMTNDVTIVRVENGEVIDRIAVGGGSRRIGLAPGNGFVYAHGAGQISLIDTRTNQKKVEHAVPGRLHTVYALESERRLIGLTSNGLMIWNAETGELAASVPGFTEPFLLLDPRAL